MIATTRETALDVRPITLAWCSSRRRLAPARCHSGPRRLSPQKNWTSSQAELLVKVGQLPDPDRQLVGRRPCPQSRLVHSRSTRPVCGPPLAIRRDGTPVGRGSRPDRCWRQTDRTCRRAGKCPCPPLDGRATGRRTEGRDAGQGRCRQRAAAAGRAIRTEIGQHPEGGEADIGTNTGYDDKEARGIGVNQQSLILIGSALMTAPCVDVVSARRPGTRMIVAVMPDSVAAYDVSQPLQPRLMGEWSFSGARGAVPWQGGVLAFGDEGFAMVDEGGMRRTNAGQCSAPPVLSAAAAGKRLYALTERRRGDPRCPSLQAEDGRTRLARTPCLRASWRPEAS